VPDNLAAPGPAACWDPAERGSIREARPSLYEVLTVRRERQAMVRHVMESLTDEQLALEVTHTEQGSPWVENLLFKECLRIVLNEEWEHRLHAERDLSSLEKEN
jgi:hypothetical protein